MKNWMMGGLITAALAGGYKTHAQDSVKIENFIPMINFGWTALPGAKDEQGRVNLMSSLVTNRAMVVEREIKDGKKTKLVQDTLILEQVIEGDTIPAEGRLMMGFNDSGADIQALFPQNKALFFLNTATRMNNASEIPIRLAKYDRRKHGTIGTWRFND